MKRIRKIAGFGTLASLGVAYGGKLSDSREILMGGVVAGISCIIALGISYIKNYTQEMREMDFSYRQLKQDVFNRIQEIKNPSERTKYLRLVDKIKEYE